MPCTSPLDAYRAGGSVVVGRGRGAPFDEQFQVRCGQCLDCRLAYARSWALRIMYEAQMHERSSFVTLTYDDEHLPPDHGLHVRDFQLFMKRLRKRTGKSLKYFQCGEYGPKTLRPHFHVAMFGDDFRDGSVPAQSKSGEPAWESTLLEEVWGKGLHQVGSLTFDSACYVARYVMKKFTRPSAKDPEVRAKQEAYFRAYERIDPDTGEVYRVRPPFVTMSRGGSTKGSTGIGADWFHKFYSDVYPHDFAVAKGQKFRPPKYFDIKMAELDQELMDELKARRKANALELSPERLAARNKVLHAKMDHFRREF